MTTFEIQIAYAICPVANNDFIGIYFYDANDTMIRAFVDPVYQGEIACQGHWKAHTGDFDLLIDFANKEFIEVPPSSITTIGFVNV